MSDVEADFAIPKDLSERGREAALALIAFWRAEGALNAGGGRVFEAPGAWARRGEEYGRGSVLVVIHDGGDHAGSMNWDYEQYERIEALAKALEPLRLFVEQCTSWYSAVYAR